MASTDPVSLVGYCGLYCNACGIRQGKIKTAVNNLRGIIAAYGFDKMMPELAKYEPSFKHYNEFEQVMDGLVKTFDGCPGCFHGGGDPSCIARSCAKERGFRTCADCDEAETCEKLAPFRIGFEGLLPGLKIIRQKGIGRYAEESQKEVDEGHSYLEESS
jgi:hypothetical protein